jgi:Metallo-beta-lactamase superfamily
MCTDNTATAHLHQPDPQVLHDFEPRVVFDLEPVDSVTVTMLMDNVTDAFMPDQGPAHRPPLPVFGGGRRSATTMEGGDVPEVPLADGGFSVLVEVAKNGARHRILFDAGTTPDGVVENMRRLEVDPSGIETIICSHGHFDHTAGLDGLIRQLGTVNLPVPRPYPAIASHDRSLAHASGPRDSGGQIMFLDCPAYLDSDGAARCGLPAEVEARYTMESTDGPLESAKIRCPLGHWFNGPIESLTRHLVADKIFGSDQIVGQAISHFL